MRKFTLPFGTDSDSNKSTHSSQAVNEVGQEHELPKITTLQILLPDVCKWTTLRVIGDAVLLDIKVKLMKAFYSQLEDAQNMGLFWPSEGGKMGKFLEEERLLSEYTGDKSEIKLEFVRKRRIRQHGDAITFVTETFPKEVYKTFLRYVSRGDHKKVTNILSKGFDPNFQCPKTGETPLTLAVMRPKPHAMIISLVGGGAHRDFCSKAGLTALHKAAIAGNFEAVKCLLDFGQSPNTIDRDGLTPLYHNILHDQDTKICHSLLYEHSVLGTCDKDGLQEIHQAARLNRVEQINLLLMYGADVNSRCVPPRTLFAGNTNTLVKPAMAVTPGDTPLHVAAAAGQRTAVMRLLSWGADPGLVNAENLTAVQVATYCGHSDLAESIRLFRGPSKLGDDPFLPVPTYNLRRRMRRAPANSYITEPSTLSTDPTRFSGSTNPETSTNHSTAGCTIHSSSLVESPTLPQCMQRTVSMGNLAPTATSALRRWDENPALSTDEPTRQGTEQCVNYCSAIAFPNQDQYNPGCVAANYTLDRKPKLIGRTTIANQNTRIQIPSSRGPVHQSSTEEPRHFSRLTHSGPQSSSPVVEPGSNGSSPGDEFQREGSQTDSGISHSSTEQRSQSPSKPMGVRIQPVISDSRTHTKDVDPQAGANVDVCRLRQSMSCFDGRQWQALQTAPDQSKQPLARAQPISRFTPRTIVLQKASPSPQSGVSTSDASFGLSLRTAKSPALVASFEPTPDKPSLQTVIRVMRGMPAYNAGIRDGDFILKINGIDVTRFSHDEVIKCLSASTSDSVCLTVVRCDSHRSASRPAAARKLVEQISKTPYCQPHLSTPPLPPHTNLGTPPNQAAKLISTGMTEPLPSFNRSPKPLDDSGMSSARSSDRTNCSSFESELIWSHSTGFSSANTSGRIPPQQKYPVHVGDSALNRPHSGSKYDSHSSRISHTRKNGMPRSRTICGIAETNSSSELNSMARSLYFARNPKFQRIGSQDSRSSISSGGDGAVADLGRSSGSSAGIARPPGCRFGNAVPPKVTLIRAGRNPALSPEPGKSQQIRVYPAHRTRRTSISGSATETDSNYTTDVILLPPPVQFR